MPTPVPTPTAEEIVTVSEITILSTDTVSEMIAADSDQDVSNEKWSRTLVDISEWNSSIRSEQGDVKKVGSIEFFEGTNNLYRLNFRNMIRNRYGKTSLSYEGEGLANTISESTLGWF